MQNVQKLKEEALGRLEVLKDAKSLEDFRVEYLGRKGKLTAILRKLKELPLNQKRAVGPLANQFKKELEEAIEFRRKELT
ncbi:MAG: phenylalanine--tRNA ligase subunit alpha, partial [Candidatus Colwellbacteria bacterium]|nr:phenylalanine--tRNA ligase subunit alpha [Candidatus Colwellbacteria bacterium]